MHDDGENVDGWSSIWTEVPLGWDGGVLLDGEKRAVCVRRNQPTVEHPQLWLGLSGPPGAATTCFGNDPAELREHVATVAAMELREAAASVARLFGPFGRGARR